MRAGQQQEQRIDIQQSQGMDEAQRQLFLNVRRSKSDDSFLGKLILNKNQIQKRPLILNINDGDNNQVTQNNIHVFKKIKKQKKKNLCDYTKNICGYITKKIIRQFAGPNYVCFVKKMCQQQICDYQECKSFYQSKIQQVTGPSHIPSLLRGKDMNQKRLKRVFTRFFEWFLKQRYLRYLLLQGKMSDKKLYIEYKNTVLLSMVQQNRTQNQQVKIQQKQQ